MSNLEVLGMVYFCALECLASQGTCMYIKCSFGEDTVVYELVYINSKVLVT